MPLYEYECDSCRHRFERIQKFSDSPVDTCPRCEGPVRKLLSSPAIQFKGSGWYITDYARKGQTGGTEATAAGKTSPGESSKGEGTGSSTKGEPAATGSSTAPAGGGSSSGSDTKASSGSS